MGEKILTSANVRIILKLYKYFNPENISINYIMNWRAEAAAAVIALVISFIMIYSSVSVSVPAAVPPAAVPPQQPDMASDDEIITSQICQETCSHQHSTRYFVIPYSSQLNLNSGCEDIKNYILSELERINPVVFEIQGEDMSQLTVARKKELIFVLENSSDMITNADGNHSPGIKFTFCCPGDDCIRP